MKRITPKDFYLDLPCSVVSIGCASETLHGSYEERGLSTAELVEKEYGKEALSFCKEAFAL